jgi:hypothetical protein
MAFIYAPHPAKPIQAKFNSTQTTETSEETLLYNQPAPA